MVALTTTHCRLGPPVVPWRRLRAAHRLARTRRWPAYLVAATTQSIHFEISDPPTCVLPEAAQHHQDALAAGIHLAAACLDNIVHVAMLYLGYSLL